MIETIPLDKLAPSPSNVRHYVDERADRELAADIEARGLLQNLVVSRIAKPRGCFAVEAGERRRRALQRLADEGKLSKDFGVRCLVIEAGPSAHEASLAENFQRLAMNPADECLAFRQLIERGADVDGIARRFGLGTRFVEGRLRLAALAPPIFEALGAGEINLDVAKAYAATPDTERQLWVFEQLGRGYSAYHPDSIRRMMTQATISAADRRARLVGEEAYVAAGGRVERDLFSDDDSARFLDVALLERLALEKMDQLAKEASERTGLAFVRPTLSTWIGHDQLDGLRRIAMPTQALTDEESEKVGGLEGEIEALAERLEADDLDEAAREEAEARLRELNDSIELIVDKPPVIDEGLKTTVGTFLLLDDQGRARLDSSLYAEVDDDADPVDMTEESRAEPEAKKRAGRLSQRLIDELAIQRRDILAVHVAADAGLAFDLAIFLMVDRTSGYPIEKSGSSLTACPPANPIIAFETPDARATIAVGQAVAVLDYS